MKKFLSLILALVMACSLIACGGSEKEEAPAQTETKTEAPADQTEAPAEAGFDKEYKWSLASTYATGSVVIQMYERFAELPVKDGRLESDTEQDLLKTFVFERHHETGKFGVGFVKGFGIKSGAMASTVAHDAHNLLVIGTNDADMALAANTLIECGGGMVAVRDGKVLGCAPLPIAGLMNDKPAEEMAELVSGLEDAWKEIGCSMPSPFMTMALIPLACLPELRLTDRGLVDCRTFQFVPLIAEE